MVLKAEKKVSGLSYIYIYINRFLPEAEVFEPAWVQVLHDA